MCPEVPEIKVWSQNQRTLPVENILAVLAFYVKILIHLSGTKSSLSPLAPRWITLAKSKWRMKMNIFIRLANRICVALSIDRLLADYGNMDKSREETQICFSNSPVYCCAVFNASKKNSQLRQKFRSLMISALGHTFWCNVEKWEIIYKEAKNRLLIDVSRMGVMELRR